MNDAPNHGISVRATGGPEVLEYSELAEPELDASKVVIDISAAGVNFIDTYHRGGL